MKKIIYLLAVLFQFTISLSSQTTTASLGNVNGIPGNNVTIPLNVTNFNNVGAITIRIQFNTSVLTWGQILNWDSQITGVLAGANGDILTIAWDGTSGVTISNGKLLDLQFLYLGGISILSFVSTQCEIADVNGNILSVNYTNGSVNPPPNTAPVITSTEITSGTAGQLYSYDVNATGNPAPTFSLTTFPSGMTINSTYGLIQWTPTAAGNFNVTVKAANGVSPDAIQSFTINVQSQNTAPVITSTAVTMGLVGQLYSYDVNATGNPAPAYSLTTFPSGMTINSTSGLIQWTPTASGNFDVTVKAANGVSPDATQSSTINVQSQNIAPVITSTAVTSGTVSQLYSYDVNATGNPAPAYSLTTFPSGMTINSTSGLIQWTPTASGNFDVTVKAANGVNPDATQSFAINVVEQTLIITYPTGGEIFEVGSNPIITYTSLGNSGLVNFDYSTNGGSTWDTIATNTEDDGDWQSWIVPNTPSTNCKIRVSDADGFPSAISSGLFTIFTNQFTEQTSIALTGVVSSSVAWGDYDNDGDLDILLTGGSNSTTYVTKIYRNNGNEIFTEQTSIALTGVAEGSTEFGDYDNDGYLDILLTGWTGSNDISKVYHNNGGNTFTEQTMISLTGVSQSSVAWGDYDNDGDLDILLTGLNGGNPVTKIYRNNGNNTFTEQTSITLPDLGYSSVAWGDYDNDKDLDILLTGYGISKIYRNNSNNTFTELTSSPLIGVQSSAVSWGDYDNDGDLDILLTGFTGTNQISKLYRNNGNSSFTELTSVPLIGVSSSSAAWGDYDNDGDLDILLTGITGSDNVSKIYRNNGDSTFTEQDISLTNVGSSSAAWGDYDNDGDLDILLTGFTNTNDRISKIYRNNNNIANIPPTAPTNLTSTLNGNKVTLNWNKSTDAQTAQNGLHYNLAIGTAPGNTNILSPMSDKSTGYRRIARLGNSQSNSWTINDLPNGTYYWSVQAVDNAFAGSNFAATQNFTILPVGIDDELLTQIPTEFKLYQNYPNPFNPATTISFGLPSGSFVSLKVFDALGIEVSTLVAKELTAGTYSFQWNTSAVPSGIYFFRIHAGSFVDTKKMILMK